MSLYDRDNPQHLQYLNYWKTLLDDQQPNPKDEKSEDLRKEDKDARG